MAGEPKPEGPANAGSRRPQFRRARLGRQAVKRSRAREKGPTLDERNTWTWILRGRNCRGRRRYPGDVDAIAGTPRHAAYEDTWSHARHRAALSDPEDAGTHEVGPACSPLVTSPAAVNRSHPILLAVLRTGFDGSLLLDCRRERRAKRAVRP